MADVCTLKVLLNRKVIIHLSKTRHCFIPVNFHQKKKKIKEACILIICTVQPRIRDHHTFNLQGAIKDHHMFTLWTDFCKMKRGIMLSDNFNTSHLIKRRIPMLKRLLYYDKLGGKFNLMYAALPSRRHRFWDINFGPRMQT